MDHLLAADVLIGDQAALPIAPGGSTQHVAPNVFYLASRIVDKLWLGIFKKGLLLVHYIHQYRNPSNQPNFFW